MDLDAALVEPGDDLGLVEADEVPDLYIGDPSFAHQPLDVAHRRRHNGSDRRHVEQLRDLDGLIGAWATRVGRSAVVEVG